MDLAQWKLRDFMTRCQWKQNDAAEFFGVDQSTISKTLKGQHWPDGAYQSRINRFYDELFGSVATRHNPLPALMSERLSKLPPPLQDRIVTVLELMRDLIDASNAGSGK